MTAVFPLKGLRILLTAPLITWLGQANPVIVMAINMKMRVFKWLRRVSRMLASLVKWMDRRNHVITVAINMKRRVFKWLRRVSRMTASLVKWTG